MDCAKSVGRSKNDQRRQNPADGHCIISEELGELAQAINDKQGVERMKEEAAHVAVTAIRFIEELEK